jgi:hypothetical protein
MVIENKTMVQYCIKSHFFDEVIKLPEEVRIVSLQFEVGFAIKRLSQPIPLALVKCGITAIRKSDPSLEVEGRLTGSRASMVTAVNSICKAIELRRNTVRVKRMVVKVGDNEGVFHRMQKKLRGDDSKVHRVTVLGLVKWTGDEEEIVQACNANPYHCKFDTHVVHTVLCDEGGEE